VAGFDYLQVEFKQIKDLSFPYYLADPTVYQQIEPYYAQIEGVTDETIVWVHKYFVKLAEAFRKRNG
jgi:hypothetical protein